MSPTTRARARSSVEHLFELVEGLEEDQLHDLLHELNSTADGNVQVRQGVEFFEEEISRPQRTNPKHLPLRPTPSFLDKPHEPSDWPRQKPRPVSGSQWRQSMRIVSAPYSIGDAAGHHRLSRHQTEPISPPLTASPPLSPPLSPPKDLGLPKRSVTAPLLVEVKPVSSAESPVSMIDDEEHPRPALPAFGEFSFGLDSAAEATKQQQTPVESEADEEEDQPKMERPVSPRAASPSPPPQADFSRMNTMPLPSFTPAHDIAEIQRPHTSTGDNAFMKPRAFRRISRPVFLSPVHVPAADDLAKKLSAYLFEGRPLSPPPTEMRKPSVAPVPASLEEMLREPLTPRSRFVFGRVEREVPSVNGIFEVLKQG